MEMGFDHETLRTGALTGTPVTPEMLAPQAISAFDWPGLRARFIAVHALRRALISHELADDCGGSFTQAGAQVLAAARQSSSLINPTALGNLKGLQGKDASAAGLSHTGGRGQS